MFRLERLNQIEDISKSSPLKDFQLTQEYILKKLTIALNRVTFFIKNNVKIYNQFCILPLDQTDKEFCSNVELRFYNIVGDFFYFQRVENYLKTANLDLLNNIQNDLKIVFINFDNIDRMLKVYNDKRQVSERKLKVRKSFFTFDFYTFVLMLLILFLNYDFFKYFLKNNFSSDKNLILRSSNNHNITYKYKNILDTKIRAEIKYFNYLEMNYKYADNKVESFKKDATVNSNWFSTSVPNQFYDEPFCGVYIIKNFTTSIIDENRVKSVFSFDRNLDLLGYCKSTLNKNTNLEGNLDELHRIIVAKLRYSWEGFVINNFIYNSGWNKDLEAVKSSVKDELENQHINIENF
jgi:hypothetical protein